MEVQTSSEKQPTVYHVGQISTDGDERPFLYDKNSKTWALMDTGAQVNLWPKPANAVEDKSVILLGANKKRIPAFGIADKMVRFGQRKQYKVQVFYADITKAIIGDKFLRENKMVYDASDASMTRRPARHTRLG